MTRRQIGWRKVLLFGDSITEHSFDPNGGCWGSAIANKLQRVCDVVCRGFSGYNSRSALLMLPTLVNSKNVGEIEAMTIFFGANDCCLEDTPTKQHIPLEEYKNNMKNMVKYLMGIGLEKNKIIFINPPVYSFQMSKNFALETNFPIPRRSEDMVKHYAKSCVEVAESIGVPNLDIYSAMLSQQDWNRFLCDGLHLSPAGGSFLADQLWPLLETRTKTLERLLPDWKDLYPECLDSERMLQEYCKNLQV